MIERTNATPIFMGYCSVNNSTGEVTAFYQEIDGVCDLNSNMLVGKTKWYIPHFVYDDSGKNNNIMNIQTPSYFNDPGTLINVTSFTFDNFNIGRIGLYNPSTNNGIGLTFIHTNGNIFPAGYTYFIKPTLPPSCFNKGTKILCLNKNLKEEYISIENLRKGDLVKSYIHGYRKIDLIGKNLMVNNPEVFSECMYKMEKTEENGMIEDLVITGGHSILVDSLGNYKEENDKIFGSSQMIDDKYLLLSAISKDFKKMENIDLYTYYHFILENNENDDERFGVWANGVLTETPSKKHFINHHYTLL